MEENAPAVAAGPMDDFRNIRIPASVHDLPDEILENIFSRLSPYRDLDSASAVCLRWNHIVKGAIQGMKTHFHQSVLNGRLECATLPFVSENYRTISGWPLERFGQMACYHDQSLYIIGGSTHRSTTFNDMWKYNLGTRSWSRLVSNGSYPSPKALASCVASKSNGNIYVFGGYAHPSSSPLMAPWRLFDELHRYSISANTWNYIAATPSPPAMAGHSCTTFNSEMVIFGGRTFDYENQRYPVSNSVWVFDFTVEEWDNVEIESGKRGKSPAPRYGQTQVAIDEEHIIIIGGCDGPNHIFKDAWLLKLSTDKHRRRFGSWEELTIIDSSGAGPPSDFHYSGCKVGDLIVFLQQSSSISPYLALLHFDFQNLSPLYQQGIIFEATREPFRRQRPGEALDQQPSSSSTSSRRSSSTPTMSIYSFDVSRVLTDSTVILKKETVTNRTRPEERFLYSVVAGRSEIVIFGGFFKEPGGRRCRVSSDIFILQAVPKTY